jgi:hypothetical protein
MNHVHLVVLGCDHCQGEHLHEVRYAGRLLASTVCSNCGHRLAKDLSTLRRAYLTDFERRLLTKPLRMLRSAFDHPRLFARELPGAVLTKPAKIGAELLVLQRRHP